MQLRMIAFAFGLLVLLLFPVLALAQTGVAFTASPDHSAMVNGQPVLTNYELRVTGAATSSTNLGKPTPTNNVITVTTLKPFFDALPFGSYSAVIAAIGPGGASVSAPTSFTRDMPLVPPRPPGSAPTIIDATGQAWVTEGIGGQQGEAVFVGNQLQITSTGGNTWNAADAFWFVHQPEDGDGDVIARVDRVDFTHRHAKGGVQFREGLTAGSRVVQLNVEPDGSIEFMRRATTNGTMALVLKAPAGSATLPLWLRLRRAGNTFSAATSRDGLTWTAFSSTSVAMAPLTHAGALQLANQGTGTAAFARVFRQ